jgi:predicted phosphodiesterase
MRIALISDIQANLLALEAVLDRIEEIEVDAVYCAGDLVGGGPHPGEVCHMVADLGIPTVQGDDDRAASGPAAPGEDAATAWTRDHTDPAALAHLRDLPTEIRFGIGEVEVRIVHRAAPGDAEGGRGVLVCGGTHLPAARGGPGGLVVDCGSVGRPADGDPRASFAVLEIGDGPPVARVERVAYDVRAVAAAIRACGLPDGLAEALVTAR